MEGLVDFLDLSHDEDFKSRIIDFEANLNQVEKLVQNFCSLDVYDKLSAADKVRYDLFQAFAVSSLYWFYLRIIGIDPSQHDIKTELNRIKDFMVRSKKLYEKQTLMPKINQEAAKRFIRSSLWTPNQHNSDNRSEIKQNIQSKKRKRESVHDDGSDDGVDDIKPAENSAK